MKVALPSGAELDVTMSPFKIARALYMSVADEMKGLKLDPKAEVDANFWKDLLCTGLASKRIEEALAECMKRCTYNGLKITDDTFEPVEARADYLMVCFGVAKENIQPFTKDLFAKYGATFQSLKNTPA
jgi:hypothetical protein